jgi:hypothetical protein
MNIHAFCKEVGEICEKMYGCDDGGDLCFNLVESGEIDMEEGTGNAARIVAQRILQM